MLKIEDVQVRVEENTILNGLNLQIGPGEIHVIMGPNGAGKSTLSKVLAGHPDYAVTGGKIQFLDEDIAELDPEVRACMGLFVSFQYPIEIKGISNFQFLYTAHSSLYKSRNESAMLESDFSEFIISIMKRMSIKEEFLHRDINDGFSGGEKKRNEILQMLVLQPKLAILDETDSGLDIDALKTVGNGISSYKAPDRSLLLITHYQRLLEFVRPDFVHVMIGGKIVTSGTMDLAYELDKKGYDWITTYA